MFCERCKNSEATIHLTEIIKDVKSEVHLCENCAREIGLNSKLSNFSLSIPEMLSFLDVNEVDEFAGGSVCTTCGLSFVDYSREYKLGCPDCYRHMADSLHPVIAAYHGSTMHGGKHPVNTEGAPVEAYVKSVRVVPKKTIEELRELLERAVMDERYEEAAVLRDRIREMESA